MLFGGLRRSAICNRADLESYTSKALGLFRTCSVDILSAVASAGKKFSTTAALKDQRLNFPPFRRSHPACSIQATEYILLAVIG